MFRAGYQELLQLTRAKRQAVGAESGFSTDLGGVENVTRAMRRQTNVETTKLEKGITFLATTGSTCPFIGLFGTVWGIMTAFMGLSAAHTSNIQAVAPGIAEALITTAFGLVAAIPAQMFYNYSHRPGARTGDRDGKFHLRIPQHRRAPFPVVRTPAPKGAAANGF